jgi:hypothetical protein
MGTTADPTLTFVKHCASCRSDDTAQTADKSLVV